VLAREVFPEQRRPGGVAVGDRQVFPLRSGQVGGLGEDGEGIERRQGDPEVQSQMEPQSQAREERHGLLESDLPGVLEYPQRAEHRVFGLDPPRRFMDPLTGLGLVFHQAQGDLLHEPDQALLVFSQGRGVRYLEDVPQRLGPFPVEPAGSQSQTAQPLQDVVDLVGHHERGKVQQRRSAESGPAVGGAGGEEPEGGVVGPGQSLPHPVVQFRETFPGLFQSQSRSQRRHPNVVFLIDHDRRPFGFVQQQAAETVVGGQFLRDDVPFHQHLPVEGGQVRHPLDGSFLEKRVGFRHFQDGVQHVLQVGLFVQRRERGVQHVPGQPDPRRDDDGTVRSALLEPTVRLFGGRRAHDRFLNWRIWSRSWAAFSKFSFLTAPSSSFSSCSIVFCLVGEERSSGLS